MEVLRRGGLIAFPTDTVYGLGASIHHEQALEALYVVKGRVPEKPIPVLISNHEQLISLTDQMPESIWRLVEAFWPGPLTLVLPKSPDASDLLSRGGTLGFRMPDHPYTLQLLEQSGPLGVSSANLSGEPSPRQADAVLHGLGGRIDLVIDGGMTPGGIPSTVIEFTKGGLALIREGPIALDQVQQVFGG